jgi:predicted short-subunit dehydrogenase-like oxidoreductase (DUF2520 family)
VTVVVVGRGKVGKALHRAGRAAGLGVVLTSHRVRPVSTRRALREAELIVLAVPDDAIAETAASIAEVAGARSIVVHCAGARSTDVLGACSARGLSVGVMHPLISFASARTSPSLRGATFVIAGDRAAVRRARAFCRALGGTPVTAAIHGARYHAAAALVANGATALASVGVDILAGLGLDRPTAARAIGSLLSSVAANVARVGVPEALTGPIVRGDADTVARHRQALDGCLDGRARDAYDALAPIILDCALAAGLDPRRASTVRRALRRD